MLKIDAETEKLFLEKLEQILVQGQVATNVTVDECTVELFDSQGELVRTQKTVKTRRSTSVLPTPTFVLELFARSGDVQSAVELLSKYGYLVINPETKEEAEQVNEQRGLSDFAVNELRAKLLGVEIDSDINEN